MTRRMFVGLLLSSVPARRVTVSRVPPISSIGCCLHQPKKYKLQRSFQVTL